MHSNLEHLLNKQFPQFFPKPTFSFECGDGWFNIIYSICKSVQNHINSVETKNKQNLKIKDEIESGKVVQEYWREKYYNNELVEVEIPKFMAAQVKEKFGHLRFYCDGADKQIQSILQMGTQMSTCTCEICGGFGKTRSLRWIRTLCDSHYVEFSNKDSEPINEKELKVDDVVLALVDGKMTYFEICAVESDNNIVGLMLEENRSAKILDTPKKYKIQYMESPVFSYYEAFLID